LANVVGLVVPEVPALLCLLALLLALQGGHHAANLQGKVIEKIRLYMSKKVGLVKNNSNKM